MKLLLTSDGLTNNSIINALKSLAVLPFNQLCVVFIPTAANGLNEDKGWLLTEMNQVYELGFGKFDIVDIASLNYGEITKRISAAEVIVFGGGDTFPLVREIENKNLGPFLEHCFGEKIYVGISAGSMIPSSKITYKLDADLYCEGVYEEEVGQGLGYVNFSIKPHFTRPQLPKLSESNVRKCLEIIQEPIYLLDDQSAIQVDGDRVSIISEGTCKLLL